VSRTAPEPTLSLLIVENKGLRIYCECNGILRILSPLEAVASYGGKVRFSELRTIIKGRCGVADCRAHIGPTVEAYSKYPR
jgi:hypothetical protein